MALDSVYRTTIEYAINGEACVNVLFIKHAGASPATASGLCAYIRDEVLTGWRQGVGGGVVFSKISAVEMVRLGAQDQADLPVNILGSDANGGAEAPQLAVCFKIGTGQVGRSKRGRIFIGGAGDAHVSGGRLTPIGVTQQGLIRTAIFEKLINFEQPPGWRLGVFSRKIWESPAGLVIDAFTPATQLQFNTVLSTMRSRKPAA